MSRATGAHAAARSTRWGNTLPWAALLGLCIATCDVETPPPVPISICLEGEAIASAAERPEPHAVVWLWPTATGFEVAGQAWVGPEHRDAGPKHRDAPLCGTVVAPSRAAVLTPEQGRQVWLPGSHYEPGLQPAPNGWRGWSPLVVLYADLSRSGAFEPSEDTVRGLETMRDPDRLHNYRRMFYLPQLPWLGRDPELAERLRMHQPHPDAPFVEVEHVNLAFVERQPHQFASHLHPGCADLFRETRCLFTWAPDRRRPEVHIAGISLGAALAAALGNTDAGPAFMLGDVAQKIRTHADDHPPEAWRRHPHADRWVECARAGQVLGAEIHGETATSEPETCTCRVEHTNLLLLTLAPPPAWWPCAPADYDDNRPLGQKLRYTLGEVGSRPLLEAMAELNRGDDP